MDDQKEVGALIERIVRGARLPGQRARDELRCELADHFGMGEASPEELRQAIARFGSERELTESFRQLYRVDFTLLYLARALVAIGASILVILPVLYVVCVTFDLAPGVIGLRGGFTGSAVFSSKVILASVAIFEIGRRPFNVLRALLAVAAYAGVVIGLQFLFSTGFRNWNFWNVPSMMAIAWLCSRCKRRPVALLLTFIGCGAVLYVSLVVHSLRMFSRVVDFPAGPLDPDYSLWLAILATLVWVLTAAILHRVDRVFCRLFDVGLDQMTGHVQDAWS
jgi:hypothetical protein